MTIIDHRILIPKSPQVIWELVSDLTRNPTWQVDCTGVSILTPGRRTGAGLRWRLTTTSNREYVAEITAWYDGLGYEYTFVDGAPYKESKGRLRLQEIAEGTIVQWSFSYETGGVLGGFRNTLSLKRQTENALVDSLKNLWKVMQKFGSDELPREAKSLMRDAPDYEARVQYKPRHPSAKPAEQNLSSAAEPALSISEPPVSEDDTRPRAPISVEAPLEEPVLVAPELVEHTLTPPEVTDTAPVHSLTPPELQAVSLDEPLAEEPLLEGAESESQQGVSNLSFPEISKLDTSEVSVFDLFGLPRPSQTQQMQPVEVPDEPTENVVAKAVAVVEAASAVPAPAPLRVGFRILHRRKSVRLRRPV